MPITNCFLKKKLRAVSFHQLQAMAFAPVKEGKSCILADQSGSGKTLAYLAPVIQHLRQEEIDGVSTSLSQSPRVVVLVPTAELASQVCYYFACNFTTWSMLICILYTLTFETCSFLCNDLKRL